MKDHREINEQLKIYTIDPANVGVGLPLWLPAGAVIIEELETFAKHLERQQGYQRVKTPHLGTEQLYQQSGHLDHYRDSMFPPMQVDDRNVYLKAMNCPHHHLVFKELRPTHKHLPLRLAEYGCCYRNEDAGALQGLMRVRSINMNDAHIYCTEDQLQAELTMALALINIALDTFQLKDVTARFSKHEPTKLGQKYINNPAMWWKAEQALNEALLQSGLAFEPVLDEAAFYGPKIDIQVRSATNREYTLSTVQVDFVGPGKLGCSYTSSNNEQVAPVCIHRAPFGTHERFIAFLLEHFQGQLPCWLAPVQIALIDVTKTETQYAEELKIALRNRYRVAVMEQEDIREQVKKAAALKPFCTIVVGDREAVNEDVSVRSPDGKSIKISMIELINRLTNLKASRSVERLEDQLTVWKEN